MRVLLVNPPLIPAGEVGPPLGLCTLAYWICDEHEVRILDLDLRLRKETGDPRVQMMSLLIKDITDYDPQVIGFTSMYNNSLQAEQLIRKCKQNFPDKYTIAGGPHFGALAKESLTNFSELDFVIEGEGEKGLMNLLRHLQSEINIESVPNLWFRQNGQIKSNPKGSLLDLGEIKPIWSKLDSIIDISEYAATIAPETKRKAMYVEAGRGCPFSCTFCAPAQFWDRQYRVKSPSVIIQEMQFLKESYGYNAFLLVHDLLTVDKRFLTNFCQELVKKDLSVEWMANSRVDVNINEILPLMKESGCWKLFYGIESASTKIQQQVRKGLSQDQVIDTIQRVSENNIESTCSFIIGFETEKLEEISDTIALGARLKLMGSETVQYHRLRLFPPAPLAINDTEFTFDMETLKLEFPFDQIKEDEITRIRNSKYFYSGYFAPVSSAGKAYQLSQVELFFQQSVSIAPITICVLSELAGNKLIHFFYKAIESIGQIDRYSIDWISNDLVDHWQVIDPYMEYLLAEITATQSSYNLLVNSIYEYEKIRLQAVIADNWELPGAIFASNGCLIFSLKIDIFEVIQRLKNHKSIKGLQANEINVVLIKSLTGEVAAFLGL